MSAADPFDFSSAQSGPGGAEKVVPLAPPAELLIVAAALLAGSGVLLLSGSFSDLAHVIGWLLASVATISVLARFTAVDLGRRQRPNYSPHPVAGQLRYGLAIAAIVLSGLHAWTLAWSLAAR